MAKFLLQFKLEATSEKEAEEFAGGVAKAVAQAVVDSGGEVKDVQVALVHLKDEEV